MNKSKNAILTIELDKNILAAGNQLAQNYFGKGGDSFDFSLLLGDSPNASAYVHNLQEQLEGKFTAIVKDTTVKTNDGQELPCDLIFDYLTPDHSVIILRICPHWDQKGFILDKFINSRKHPAFTLDVHQDLRIIRGNKLFYSAFACTEESLLEKYDNQFASMLSEDTWEEDATQIHEALQGDSCGILEIRIQTARGENLYFYYNKEKLKLIQDDWNNNLFCMLVDESYTLEDLEAEWTQTVGRDYN